MKYLLAALAALTIATPAQAFEFNSTTAYNVYHKGIHIPVVALVCLTHLPTVGLLWLDKKADDHFALKAGIVKGKEAPVLVAPVTKA